MRVPIFTPALLAALILPLPREANAQTPRRIARVEVPEKIALVIGNDGYRRSPLANALNDARAMGEILQELGFEVLSRYDVDQRSFDLAIGDFVSRLGSDDIALFFYAGHGVQIDGLNYLIPVDFEASDAVEVRYRSFPADLVRDRMEATGTTLNILIFDACRDNPFRATRSLGGGLAQMRSGTGGTFIAFSTAPGKTADDDPASHNSLFTRNLIETLDVPGLSLDEVFNEVRRKVHEESAGRQLPWASSSVIGEFHFRPLDALSSIDLPGLPARGSLRITGNIYGAEVLLNGNETDVRRTPTGELYIPDLPTGSYRVTVRRTGYLDAEELVHIEPGTMSRLSIRLEGAASAGPEPPPETPLFITDATDPFCLALERILGACSQDFRDLVNTSLTESRLFLDPTVAFPNAWYNKIFRASTNKHKFVSSFQIGPGNDPEIAMANHVTKVESCLAPGVISDKERGPHRHRIDIATRHGYCEIEIAINGQNIEIEIVDHKR